ncbi:MAG: hypothetical protein GY869_04885, partial [Planctomycetes bacterium]|nr:hypothetical protein [Planctomycetota bacterium]
VTAETLVDISSDNSLNIYGLTPIIPNMQPAIDFQVRYNEIHSVTPQWFSYYGCDAAKAFDHAITKAVNKTREDVWQAIPNMSFEGITGKKTFNEKGDLYSGAYDLHCVINGAWNKVDTIHIENPAQGSSSAKVATRTQRPSNAEVDFTYSLTAADPLISHFAGEQAHGTGWLAESLDAPMGGVLMAYYEDVERGLSTDNQTFAFEDGRTYNLTFNVFRVNQTDDAPSEGGVFDVTVKSVYRYQNGDGVTHYARQELLNQIVSMNDWPSDSSQQITIPVAYRTAAPGGVAINNDDNRFHWELKLLNTAKQKVVLTTVEIGTGVPTAVGDFMLH